MCNPRTPETFPVIVTNVAGSVTSSVAVLTVQATNPRVIAQWNFNSLTPDANSTATGSTAPSIGTGTALLAGRHHRQFCHRRSRRSTRRADDRQFRLEHHHLHPAQGSSGNKTRGAQFVGQHGREAKYCGQLEFPIEQHRQQIWTIAIFHGPASNFVDYPNLFYEWNDVYPQEPGEPGRPCLGVTNNPNFTIRLVGGIRERTAIGTAQ